MAEVKSHEFDHFLRRKDRTESIFLIYGPDRGLVSERAGEIAHNTGIDLQDPFTVTKLDAGELQSGAGQLIDEMNSIGLFGGEKLVWVRGTGSEKALVDAVSALAKQNHSGSRMIVEAGDLKKTSALRKTAESAPSAVAIACYPDDNRSLSLLIDQQLGRHGLTISPDARAKLLESIGGDRLASRNEIEKLALYCHGLQHIELYHVIDCVADASGISVDEAVDAILSGDPDQFLLAINRIVASKTAIFLVLQACLRQFQLLDIMRNDMEANRSSASQSLATLGRHLHFKRKPIVEKALKAWPADALKKEMNRLNAAILQTRQRQILEDSIAINTLLSTTLQTKRYLSK
jgi:DNA polymerase III subunit delta